MADPTISGLTRQAFHLGGESEADPVDLQPPVPTYSCIGGEPVILFPPISCPNPGPDGWSSSFTINPHQETFPGSGIWIDEIYPPPDLALIEIEVGLVFSPYTIGCRRYAGDGGTAEFGCLTPAEGYGEASFTIEQDTGVGLGVADFQPAGVTPWNLSYDPGRDPDYFDGFDMDNEIGPTWSQGGLALMKPPDPFYDDPDPLDPSLPYVPYLWRWRDILATTITIDVSGDTWHRIRDLGSVQGMRVTITPYRYNVPPVHSGTGGQHVL
jgi:hypothetical protein